MEFWPPIIGAEGHRLTMPRRKFIFLVLIMAGASMITAGCIGGDPNAIASRKIADALPDVIGPAKHYDVSVDGNAMSLSRGHASRVQIDGQDVQVSPSLVMNTLHVDAHDMALDTKTRKVEHAGSVEFNAAIGQLNLDRYLASSKSTLSGLTVKIRWTDLEASVPVSAVGISATVVVDGTLAPSSVGADKLDFIPEGADVGVVPIPHKLLEIAMNRINPVVDLSGMKFPVTVESAGAQNGRLMVVGSTTLGQKPTTN